MISTDAPARRQLHLSWHDRRLQTGAPYLMVVSRIARFCACPSPRSHDRTSLTQSANETQFAPIHCKNFAGVGAPHRRDLDPAVLSSGPRLGSNLCNCRMAAFRTSSGVLGRSLGHYG